MRGRFWLVAAIALGAAIFGLGRSTTVMAQRPAADPFAPPPAAAGTHQGDAPAAARRRDAKARTTAPSPATERIEGELAKNSELDVVEMPLKDVVIFLQERHNIPIVLNGKKIEEASVSLDTPVTKSLRGVRLSTILDIVLEDLDLAYYVGEVLTITSRDDARTRTEVRVYDCRDILAQPTRPGQPEVNPAHRAEQLMGLVTTNVDPDSWKGSGGMPMMGTHAGRAMGVSQPPGAISEYDGLLVVTQTANTHRKVEHVLNMLREAAGLEAKMGRVVR